MKYNLKVEQIIPVIVYRYFAEKDASDLSVSPLLSFQKHTETANT